QIKRTGEQGGGMALAGLLLGWAAVALGIIAILGVAVFVVSSAGPPRAPGAPSQAGAPAARACGGRSRPGQRGLSGWGGSAAVEAPSGAPARPIAVLRALP